MVPSLRLLAVFLALMSPWTAVLTAGLHHGLAPAHVHGLEHEHSLEAAHGEDHDHVQDRGLAALVHGHDHAEGVPEHEHSAPVPEGAPRIPPPVFVPFALSLMAADHAAVPLPSPLASPWVRRAPSPFSATTPLFHACCCLLV